MTFCTSCNSSVSADEAPVIQMRGKCTRCHIRSLPPLPSPLPVRVPAPVSQAPPARVVMVGVLPIAGQRTLASAHDSTGLLKRDLTLHESLVWCEEHGLVDDVAPLN